jgi:hypothetical protein
MSQSSDTSLTATPPSDNWSKWASKPTSGMKTLKSLYRQSGDEEFGIQLSQLERTLKRVEQCKSSITCGEDQCACPRDPTRTVGVDDFEHDFTLLAWEVWTRGNKILGQLLKQPTGLTSVQVLANDLANLQRVLDTDGEVILDPYVMTYANPTDYEKFGGLDHAEFGEGTEVTQG